MRFKLFIALIVIALVLDIGLLAASLANPGVRLFELAVAVAAPQAAPTATMPATAAPTSTALPPTATATATATPPPTATATSSPTATSLPTVTAVPPTATPEPAPRVLVDKSVSFTPSDKAVRENIRLALAHYYGALTHVVLEPGQVFSFNATLGVRPQALPWKNVRIKPTAAPAAAVPEGTTPVPAPDPQVQLIQGGGLCDLASRFVMASRSMLPTKAFHFVNHVNSNGIHLSGVPVRDSVSIWAVGGGPGEQDLTIANTTAGWLEFTIDRAGEKITVTAQLWDRSPPNW